MGSSHRPHRPQADETSTSAMWRKDDGSPRWMLVTGVAVVLAVIAFVVLWVLPYTLGWWYYSSSSTPTYAAPQYYIVPNTTYSFEYPAVGLYALGVPGFDEGVNATAYDPWAMPYIGNASKGSGAGIAAQGSYFDPPGSSTAPCGTQYAFLQAALGYPVGMTTSVVGLVQGKQYQTSFYFGQRRSCCQGQSLANTTYNSLTVQLTDANDRVTVIDSIPAGTNTYGTWLGHTSATTFTWAGAGYPQLALIATPHGTLDTSLLIDCFEILTVMTT